MRALLCLLVVALGTAAPALAEDDRPSGPVGLRTQGTLREIFLDVTLFDARALDRPQLDVRWAVANTWNEPMSVARGAARMNQLLDEQADSLTLQARAPWSWLLDLPVKLPGSERPLGARLSTAIEARVMYHWGGWSDRPIEAWHSLTGAFNYQREKFPRNEIFLDQEDTGGRLFLITHPTLAFGDVVLRNAALLAEGSPGAHGLASWGLSLRLDLKLPTGSLARASGSGGFDQGLALQGTAQLADSLTLHGQLGLSHLGPVAADTRVRNNEFLRFLELSLEWDAGPFTALLEDRLVSAIMDDQDTVPGSVSWQRQNFGGNDGYLSSGMYATFRAHNQFSFAARWWRLTLWLSEDFTPGSNVHATIPWEYESNAPDVVIGLVYAQKL